MIHDFIIIRAPGNSQVKGNMAALKFSSKEEEEEE
jgi:hypothetical protein